MKHIGEKHITNEGLTIEILECVNSICTIKFESGLVLNNKNYQNIKNEEIKNPYHCSVYDTGYLGVGKYIRKHNKKTYYVWSSLLERCYSKTNKFPSYIGCKVHEKWHNFQNFAKWFEENYIEEWHLDKDILIKGNKIYSPETCCFVPREINNVIIKQSKEKSKYPIGVFKGEYNFIAALSKENKVTYLGTFNTPEEAFQSYKTAKEAYIKEVADKWQEQISEKIYNALINYKIEIID